MPLAAGINGVICTCVGLSGHNTRNRPSYVKCIITVGKTLAQVANLTKS